MQDAEREEQWRKSFPSGVANILSICQAVLTIAIIGCEVGSVLIDILYATIYVGFWAGIFFMITWISQAGSACCCRSRRCATYTMVMNCISMFFALCVIGFDAYFVMTPTSCFFPTSTCTNAGSSRGLFYTSSNFDNIKMSLIKGQLAAGAVVFVLCAVYIILYVVTSVRLGTASANVSPQNQPTVPVVPTGLDGMIKAPPITNVRQARVGSPLYHRPTAMGNNGDGITNELLCPSCNTSMFVSIHKQLPLTQ